MILDFSGITSYYEIDTDNYYSGQFAFSPHKNTVMVSLLQRNNRTQLINQQIDTGHLLYSVFNLDDATWRNTSRVTCQHSDPTK